MSSADTGAFAYRLASPSARERLSWRDRSGKRLEPYFDFDGRAVELSPDGRRAVVARGGDLWLIDLARALPTRFTSFEGFEGSPAWSPESFAVITNPQSDIVLAKLTGGGAEKAEGTRQKAEASAVSNLLCEELGE
jgi:hypothetical protein